MKNPTVKKMKLAMLKVTRNDGIFAAVSIVWTVLCVLVSVVSPL